MADSLFAAQASIYSALAGAAAVQAQVGNPARVYDHVPINTTYPYIELGEVTARDFATKTTDGMEQTITLHAWSRYAGRKQVKDILKAIYDTLNNAALSISGSTLVLCRFEFADTMREDDGLTYHGVARYRLIVD